MKIILSLPTHQGFIMDSGRSMAKPSPKPIKQHIWNRPEQEQEKLTANLTQRASTMLS